MVQGAGVQGAPSRPGRQPVKQPSITVGAYNVRYVAERLCTVGAVTSPLRECLVKQEPQDAASRANGKEVLDPPNAPQYRVTVRVSGPKDTQSWVQSLVTKG